MGLVLTVGIAILVLVVLTIVVWRDRFLVWWDKGMVEDGQESRRALFLWDTSLGCGFLAVCAWHLWRWAPLTVFLILGCVVTAVLAARLSVEIQ